jgi:hypothetical protein
MVSSRVTYALKSAGGATAGPNEHHDRAARWVKAFAALEALSAEVVRTGASSDAIELVVVDEHASVVPRPVANSH